MPRPTPPGAAESQIDLRPGERMAVADLLRALLLESANDAAVTLACARPGRSGGFVDLMNDARRAARARRTRTSRTRSGSTSPATTRPPATSSRLARRVLRNDFLAETVDMPRARLLTGARARGSSRTATTSSRAYPFGRRREDGAHGRARATCWSARRSRKGARLVSVVLGRPVGGGPRHRHAARCCATGSRSTGACPRCGRARRSRTRQVAYFGDREVQPRGRRAACRLTVRRGERVRTVVDAPGELDGPLDAGRAGRLGAGSSAAAGVVRTRAARDRRGGPGGRLPAQGVGGSWLPVAAGRAPAIALWLRGAPPAARRPTRPWRRAGAAPTS